MVGCGPSGLYVVKAVSSYFRVLVVEPKDYFEFTPGILRGLCYREHLQELQAPLAEVLGGYGVELVRGRVVDLQANAARIRLLGVEGQEPCIADEITAPFDFAVIAAGSQCAGPNLWKITGAPGEEEQTLLPGRVRALGALRDELAGLAEQGGTAVVVGGGLVGVELAAELAHFMPTLKVAVCDRKPELLPSLPEGARTYALAWLEDHGVAVHLGQRIERGREAAALGIQGPVKCLTCCGVSVRCDFAEPLACFDPKGQIRVNAAGQVLTTRGLTTSLAIEGKMIPPTLCNPEAATGPAGEACQIFGDGHIFALGDCVVLDGVQPPLAKDTYPAEAMAGVVAANLKWACAGHSLSTNVESLYKLSPPLNHFTLVSLGPDDCIFIANGRVMLTGWMATKLKLMIESTKMGEARQEVLSSLLWWFVPHW